MPGKYKALLFDFFETLVRIDYSALPVWRMATGSVHTPALGLYTMFQARVRSIAPVEFHEAYARSFWRTEKRRWAQERELGDDHFVAHLLETLGVRADAALVAECVEVHARLLQTAFRLMPDAEPVLSWARDHGFILGLISNYSHAPSIRSFIRRTPCLQGFRTVRISAEVGVRKPHPLMFTGALERIGMRPEDVLYVGDQLQADVFGALQAGIPVAWLDRGVESRTSADPSPSLILRSLFDLPALILQRGTGGDTPAPHNAAVDRRQNDSGYWLPARFR